MCATAPSRLGRLLGGLAGLLCAHLAWAAEALPPYNIPIDTAERSLKAFATPSGLEVLFATLGPENRPPP